MINGTVVIPAYNEEKRLEETIKNAKNQKTGHSYNIIVVDNGSEDKTKDIAHKQGVTVVEEKIKGVKFARTKGIEAAKDLFNSRIILQLDADSHVGPNWIEEHLNNYEEENVGIVGGSIEWTGRSLTTTSFINTLDFFRGRILDLTELRLKDYFEKRKFWLEKGVLPIPGTNMSYLSDLGIDEETILGGSSSLGEDYYKATKIYKKYLSENPTGEVRLLDNKNILVKTPSRGDHDFFNFLKLKYRYKKSNTIKAIENGKLENENYQMSDYR